MSSGNGHDPATKQMIELLLGVQAGLDQLNSRFAVLHEDMLGLRADVTGIRNEMHSLRPELRADLDSLAERTAHLEKAVFKPAAE